MRDFLKGLDLDEKTIGTIMAEHGKRLALAKESAEELKATLSDVQGRLKAFEAVDVEKLHGEIKTLKASLAEKDKEHQAKIADMSFNSALLAAISACKGKNAKGIIANLDIEALKASKNQEADIKAALAALRESDSYFFEAETPPPYAGGTGSAPMMGVTHDEYKKMGYADRLKLKQDNPALYEQFTKG